VDAQKHYSARVNIKNLLKNSDFFSGISEPNIDRLVDICIPKRVPKKEVLFLEGSEGHSAYFLVQGSVELFKVDKNGKRAVIRVMGPGDFFAEVVLFERADYPVTAVTLEESLLLLLPKYQAHCLLRVEDFRNDFINMLIGKQRQLTDRILHLMTRDAEERFFHFLQERYGKRDEYTIGISKKKIAAAVGTNPETFSRLIHRLRSEGTIRWESDRLSLKPGFWNEG